MSDEDEAAAARAALDAVAKAAVHAFTQAEAAGCCCKPDVVMLGWKPSPDDESVHLPLLAILHEEWCPHMRSREESSEQGRVRLVQPDGGEGS